MTALDDLYPPRARPLPIRVRPFPDETPASFLHRIATANYLSDASLKRAIRLSPLPDREAVASLSGIDQARLGHAIPSYHPDPEHPTLAMRPHQHQQIACHRCVRRRVGGGGTRVVVYSQPWRVTCPHHHTWLREAPDYQYDLTGLPAYPTAIRRHRTLVERYGAALTDEVVEQAQDLMNYYATTSMLIEPRIRQALQQFRGTARAPAHAHARLTAATYPVAIDMAGIILKAPRGAAWHTADPKTRQRIRQQAAPLLGGQAPVGPRDRFLSTIKREPWSRPTGHLTPQLAAP